MNGKAIDITLPAATELTPFCRKVCGQPCARIESLNYTSFTVAPQRAQHDRSLAARCSREHGAGRPNGDACQSCPAQARPDAAAMVAQDHACCVVAGCREDTAAGMGGGPGEVEPADRRHLV